MAFVGNTKHTVPYMLRNNICLSRFLLTFSKRVLSGPNPCIQPGWEVKVLKKSSFSTGYGLITDYISAILHELRNIDYSSRLNQYAKFSGTLSERDHNAISKTFSGFCKLLYPNGVMTDEEAKELIDFAAEVAQACQGSVVYH